MAIKLFPWYDRDTRFAFLEFYRQFIENEDDEYENKDFKRAIGDILSQEEFILNVVQLCLFPSLIQYSERIITSIIKRFFDASLD